MKKKKMIFAILVGILIFISIYGGLFFYTYTVSGKITDLANKETVSGVEISIGNTTVKTDKDGLFRIENIKIYQRKDLKINPPENYEEMNPVELDYSHRNIIQNIEIIPTFETMVSRFNTAVRNVQHDYLWDYMHPDDQEYWESKDNYVSIFKKRNQIAKELNLSNMPELEIGGNIRKLDTWKHKITGKEYTNVMEVPIEAKINENASEIELEYYEKVDGVWRYFTETDKKELQEMIDKYEELKKLFSN